VTNNKKNHPNLPGFGVHGLVLTVCLVPLNCSKAVGKAWPLLSQEAVRTTSATLIMDSYAAVNPALIRCWLPVLL
jgi:hypothetical protein